MNHHPEEKQPMADRPHSRLLAEFVSSFPVNDIPEPVLVRTRQSVLNAIAAALSAATQPPIDRLIAVSRKLGETGESPLFGRSERTTLLSAALINGFMAHYNDYDDTHLITVFHTNSPVVPPALLLAADRHLSGTELWHSLALGLEASMRFGVGMGPEHYDIGWHITGTAGTVGAALSCARLMKLDALHTNYALGFSLTQASGLRGQMFGTAAKGINAGSGSMNGLLSALLAEEGLDAAEDAIEGKIAYATAAAPKPQLDAISDGLGKDWMVPDIAFKPYASGVATHAAIDSAIALRQKMGLTPSSTPAEVDAAIARLEKVDLTLPERYLHLPRGQEITAPLQAKFSSYNAVSLGFAIGRVGPKDFFQDITVNPQLVGFRNVLKLVGEADLPKDASRIRAVLKDGSVLEHTVEHATGSKDRPMSDDDIRNKFMAASEDLLSPDAQNRLVDMTMNLDAVKDVAELVELTRI
jgi:2-methylcitrate dehydratase PrpD